MRAGDVAIVREGIGTGIGRSASAETAHEIALKAAETDATKRALATFGNPFGLALYDKDKRGVTKQRRQGPRRQEEPSASRAPGAALLHHADGRTARFDSVAEFVTAAVQAVQGLRNRAAVYAFWEANLESFAASAARRVGQRRGSRRARLERRSRHGCTPWPQPANQRRL